MKIAALLLVVSALSVSGSAAAQSFGGFGDSPFERDFGDIKYLDSYFGTFGSKAEVAPGDINVPFTLVLANVGTHDITGIRGELSLTPDFTPAEGRGMVADADSHTNAMAGEIFHLTFYLNVGSSADIQQYPAAAKVEYSRLRESGVRNAFFDFYFMVPGSGIPDIHVPNAFLMSLQTNTVRVQVTNDGMAPLSNAEVTVLGANVIGQGDVSERVVLSESYWDIGNVEPGGVVNIDIHAFIPENIRGVTLRLPLEVKYFNTHGDPMVVSRSADFYVRGLVDLSIYGVDTIRISDTTMIVGEIINEGNEAGLFSFVSIDPLGDSNIMPSTQFLDEIQTDSPVPFNMPIEFEGEPMYGPHDIQVNLRYKDDIREEHFLTYNTTITLEAPPLPSEDSLIPGLGAVNVDGTDDTLVIVVVGVILVGLIVILVGILRRRRRNDD